MSNVRMAYLLVAHTAPQQVNALIRQLSNYGDCEIYIHVDKKNASMADELFRSSRVHVYCEYDVRWGSFEIVKAAFFLMEKALGSGKEYTHFYFGSGQDLLVKKGLYEYLERYPEKTFIRINREITDKDRESARYRVMWPHKLMRREDWNVCRIIRILIQLLCRCGLVLFPNKRQLTSAMRFYEGRTWFIAPGEVIGYIVRFIAEHEDYVRFWEHSLASDLMFFQTIIMNSKYRDSVADELMYVNFGKTFGTMNHPLDITIEDDRKIERGDFYCARKFNIEEKDVFDYYLRKVES